MDSVIILLLIANERYDWLLICRFVVGVGNGKGELELAENSWNQLKV